MHQRLLARLCLAAAALLAPTQAHSWVELLRNIGSDGSFVGSNGYPRGWQNRSQPGFSDLPETWQVENGHGSNPNLCAPGEQDASSQGTVPRLQATPGSPIALLYQENGHVSIPSNNPAKPANRGTVYIYATQNPKAGEKYYDIYQKWNVAGNGGDGRGRLISTQNFDDGRCFQINNGAISKARQAANPFTPSNPMGGNLWCQNNIVIPNDVDTSKLLTLYWVWKWDDLPHVDPKVWNGQNQTYTSCLDIALKPASKGKAQRKFAYTQGQSPQQAGLGNIFNELAAGNVFAVSAYTDGMYPTPAGPASSAGTTSIPVATSAAATSKASTTGMASQCGNSVASVQTVFIFGTSTGTIAPTGTGLSFSTESGTATSTSSTKTRQPQASTTASSAVTTVTQSSDGQPEASAGSSSSTIMVTQASDGQPEAPTAAPTQNTATSSQSSATQQQSPTTSSAAATSTISDNPVVIPVPTNPTASFTFEPSVTETATAITPTSATASSGVSTTATSAVTAGANSSTPASTAAATASKTSTSPSPSSGPCKASTSKRQSKIFGPLHNPPVKRNIIRRSIDRAHPRHWRES